MNKVTPLTLSLSPLGEGTPFNGHSRTPLSHGERARVRGDLLVQFTIHGHPGGNAKGRA